MRRSSLCFRSTSKLSWAEIVSRSREILGAATATCADGRDATGEFEVCEGTESVEITEGRRVDSVHSFVGAGASVAESERLRFTGIDKEFKVPGASILTSSIILFPPIEEGQGTSLNMP
jgi:hypothetical protein